MLRRLQRWCMTHMGWAVLGLVICLAIFLYLSPVPPTFTPRPWTLRTYHADPYQLEDGTMGTLRYWQNRSSDTFTTGRDCVAALRRLDTPYASCFAGD